MFGWRIDSRALPFAKLGTVHNSTIEPGDFARRPPLVLQTIVRRRPAAVVPSVSQTACRPLTFTTARRRFYFCTIRPGGGPTFAQERPPRTVRNVLVATARRQPLASRLTSVRPLPPAAAGQQRADAAQLSPVLSGSPPSRQRRGSRRSIHEIPAKGPDADEQPTSVSGDDVNRSAPVEGPLTILSVRRNPSETIRNYSRLVCLSCRHAACCSGDRLNLATGFLAIASEMSLCALGAEGIHCR